MPSDANNETITITFLHPRDSRKLPVEVGLGLTGEQAVTELVKANFIERAPSGKAYSLQLQRTSASMPLSKTLVDSGAKEGDVVAVVQASEGAGG